MKISKALIAGITAPLLIAFLIPAPKTWAADCTKACLAVAVENGQIVVSGQKGNGPKSKKVATVVKKVTAGFLLTTGFFVATTALGCLRTTRFATGFIGTDF